MMIMHEWQTVSNQSSAIRSLFVDFRKTFDSVNHNILLHKLQPRNTQGERRLGIADFTSCTIQWCHYALFVFTAKLYY